MMSDNEKIVSRIDSLAKSKGTSIAEIERSVGFGNGKIGKWEKAPKSPPFESLSELPEEYKITSVSSACNGHYQRDTYKGYIWEYAEG